LKKKEFLREWELSYRLGMREDKVKNIKRLVSNACPEKSDIFSMLHEIDFLKAEETDSPEPNELQGKHRRRNKGFALPSSNTFLKILEKRKQNGRDIYLEYMEKFKNKKPDYLATKTSIPNSSSSINRTTGPELSYSYMNNLVPRTTKSDFIDTKTGVFLYLEKHRILPGHKKGKYNEQNVVLLTFSQHVIAHYLRFLQYGNIEDRIAVNMMLLQNDEQIRRDMASYAGKLGGKKQQQNLRESNRGWYNRELQKELGKKGAAAAKLKKVGAFDPQNLLYAGVAWKEKYEQDPIFQNKMSKNLRKGLETQAELGLNIHDSKSQRYRVINGKGIRVDGKIIPSPYSRVYSDETFEYSEHRIHLSEDFYWNYMKHHPVAERTNYRNPKSN
jgi:hypothetical protein